MYLLQYPYQYQGAEAAGIGALIAMGCGTILGIAVFIFFIYCYWKICAKAGYSGALSLLNLVPIVGSIIVVCILAFGKWPIHTNRGDNNQNQG
jgi:uncharacterized membrane protein YhaH (DUF805 family)